MVKHAVSNNIKCPFCGTTFYRSDLSYVCSRFYLKRLKNRLEIYPLGKNVAATPKLKQHHPELLRLEMSACPNCHRITVRAVGIGDQYPHHRVFNIYPRFNADPIPKYVPDQIRQDYKEANEVYEMSPNSAAMLARRILEEILADFYHIQEGDLYHDLDQLRKTKNSPRVWQAIDSIRRLGNIGAHQTNDVDNVFGNVSVKGAKEIIGLIRMVIHDTYVEDHLSRHLEKSVIRSAKKLHYQPHYYSYSQNYHSRYSHNGNHSHDNQHHQRHDYKSNSHRNHRSHNRNNQKNRNNGRNKSNQKRSKRNYKRRSKRSESTRRRKSRRKNYRKSSRSQRLRRTRQSHHRSTHKNKKSNVKDKSFTIIQDK